MLRALVFSYKIFSLIKTISCVSIGLSGWCLTRSISKDCIYIDRVYIFFMYSYAWSLIAFLYFKFRLIIILSQQKLKFLSFISKTLLKCMQVIFIQCTVGFGVNLNLNINDSPFVTFIIFLTGCSIHVNILFASVMSYEKSFVSHTMFLEIICILTLTTS